jgi:hypothetical protein
MAASTTGRCLKSSGRHDVGLQCMVGPQSGFSKMANLMCVFLEA